MKKADSLPLTSRIWNCIPCRAAAIITGIILGLVLTILVAANPLLNGIVKPALLESLNKNENLSLKVGYIHFSLFLNSVVVNKSEFTFYDSTGNSRNSIKISVPSLSLAGIKWLSLISGNYSFGTIELTNPLINIKRMQNGIMDSDNNSSQQNISAGESLRNILNREMKSFHLSNLIINDGRLFHHSASSDESVKDSIGNFSLVINGFADGDNSSRKLIFAEEIKFSGSGIHRRLDRSGYDFKINKIDLSSPDSLVRIKSFSVSPFISDEEFFDRRSVRGDRWKIKLPAVTIKSADIYDFFSGNNIAAESIGIENFEIEIYTDKRIPVNPEADPKMPHELISSLNYGVEINKLNLENGEVILESMIPKVKGRAHLSFEKINAYIKNISNNPAARSQSNPATIEAAAYIQGEGLIKIKMNLPLLTDTLMFDYEGSLGRMSALKLNSHIEIEDKSSIKSGVIDSVSFNAQVYDHTAEVNIVPFYQNLEIGLLNENATEEKDISTFIANLVQVRESNPDDGKVKEGKVNYFIGPKDAFLDIVWQAILKGLGEVVGF